MTKGYGDRWWEDDKPADLEISPVVAAASAAAGSKDSYTKKVRLPLVNNKVYKFWATYLHEDEETKKITESDRSPVFQTTFDIPNLTKAVKNLTLTPGFKSYGVKFDLDPLSIQEDVVIFESLTSNFATQNIVYVGTSTNVTIQTANYLPRWVKVRSRDKWDDDNISEATAGPVTPLNSEIDTTKVPKAPTGVSVIPSIDPEDKSGFSIKIDVSWTASTDADTNGYVIRWSANNPATVANPLWEYGQVDGKATTTFSITGLTPNTIYYWQVTAKSPFNSISWDTSVAGQVASGTFGPVSDPNAPAGNLQLRSVLSIGGKTADLFKIGTGITQSINTSTTITPTQTSGTYNGIILDRSTTNFGHNYWLNTGQFRVGSASSFLYWDGSDVYTTGKINATGGVFTGNLRVTTGSIIAGGTFAQDGTVSGARVVMQSGGLYAHSADGAQSVVIQASDGLIDARKGFIGGWTINATTQTDGYIQSSNTKIESSGNITLGNQVGSVYPIVRLSATDEFRLWVGSNSSSNAPFKVSKEGILYATGAVIGLGAGSTIPGYATSDQLTSTNSNLSGFSTTITALSTRVTNAENALPGKASTGDITALTTAIGLKAAQAFVEEQLALKATLAALDLKLNANAYSVLDVAAKINAIDTSVVTISGGKITAGSVDTLQIAAGAITALKIGAGEITADQIAGGTITADEIAGGTITAAEIASGTITADLIEAGTITAGKIAATQTFTGHTIVGNRIATSSSSTRVELINNTNDSLRAIISGSTVGHVLGYGTASSGGMVMHYGSTANPDVTSGHVRVQSNYAILVGTASNYVEVDSNNIYLRNGTGGVTANLNSLASGAANMRFTGSQMYYVTSTRDSKTNIQDISFTDDQVKSLRPRQFQGKEDLRWGIERYGLGLIAEEVAEIEGLETILDKDIEGNLVGINYDRISIALIDTIKRVLNRLDALEAK
jgi:hypothetical protein